jgi:hypothetical protein
VNRKATKNVKKKSGHFSEKRENRCEKFEGMPRGVYGQLSERGCT